MSTSFSTTRRGEDALEAVLRAVKHQSIKLQKRPRITPRVPGAGFHKDAAFNLGLAQRMRAEPFDMVKRVMVRAQ